MQDKLKNFSPVYVINLSERKDRKNYIKKHFKKYKVLNYKFIAAIDGRNDRKEIDKLLHEDSFTDDLRNPEIAVIMSHLKAINYWLNNSDSEYAIFCEDDVDLSTSDLWDFTWEDFIKRVPGKYDVIQMNITNPRQIPLHERRRYKEYSAGCYLITRKHAKRLIKKHIIDGKYKISGNRKEIVADELIYNAEFVYSVGLFTYKNEESNINPDKINGSHQRSINEVKGYWEKNRSIPIGRKI